MTVHLLRVGVGIEDIAHLRRVLARNTETGADGRPWVTVTTRFTPRRAADVLDGGSLYWIIKRQVRARQAVLAIETIVGEGGKPRCAFRLSPELVLTEPQPRRPHQGWRYYPPEDAPPDLAPSDGDLADMPDEMRGALRELGLI